MTVKFGGIEFDNVFYDVDADVLYMHIGSPATAVDFGESSEGHHTRYDAAGDLVGITVVNARWLLDGDGVIVVTLPDRRLEVRDLGDVLSAA